MRRLDTDKIYQTCSIAAFCALCVLLTNCTIFGTGNFLYTLGISVIAISVAAMGLLSVPVLLIDFKKIIKNVTLWVLIAFAVWNVVAAVVGLRNGNSVSAIIADIKGVSYYVLFPLILAALTGKKRVHILMKCMIAAAFIQGLLACVLLWTYVFDNILFLKLLKLCKYAYFINFTNISDKIPRLLFVSAPFQLCGCAFSIYFIMCEKKFAVQYVFPLGFGLFTILLTYTRALYLGAAVTAGLLIVLALIYARNVTQQKKFWIGVVLGVVVFGMLLCGFSMKAKTDYFSYGLKRVFASGAIVNLQNPETTAPTTPAATEPATPETTAPTTPAVTEPVTPETTAPTTPVVTEPVTPETTAPTTPAVTEPVTPETTAPTTPAVTEPSVPEETKGPTTEFRPGIDGSYTEDSFMNATTHSDRFRETMVDKLWEMIGQRPIAGHGLGTPLPEGRVNAEYSFLDLGVKKGIVGMILYLLPALLMVVAIVKDIFAEKKLLLSGVWLAVLLGFFVFSIYQPYLNNAPCMLMHCCALCVRYAEQREMAVQENKETCSIRLLLKKLQRKS